MTAPAFTLAGSYSEGPHQFATGVVVDGGPTYMLFQGHHWRVENPPRLRWWLMCDDGRAKRTAPPMPLVRAVRAAIPVAHAHALLRLAVDLMAVEATP